MLTRNSRRAACAIVAFFAISSYSMNKVDGIAAVIGDSAILLSELDAYTMVRLGSSGQKPDSAIGP